MTGEGILDDRVKAFWMTGEGIIKIYNNIYKI